MELTNLIIRQLKALSMLGTTHTDLEQNRPVKAGGRPIGGGHLCRFETGMVPSGNSIFPLGIRAEGFPLPFYSLTAHFLDLTRLQPQRCNNPGNDSKQNHKIELPRQPIVLGHNRPTKRNQSYHCRPRRLILPSCTKIFRKAFQLSRGALQKFVAVPQSDKILPLQRFDQLVLISPIRSSDTEADRNQAGRPAAISPIQPQVPPKTAPKWRY